MSYKIRDIISWWNKYEENDLLITTENKKVFLTIEKLAIPHLLGLHYAYKEPHLIGAGRILKNISGKKDEEILDQIRQNNPKKFSSVKKRINTFVLFMKNLESAILVENTNHKTKIRSQHFFIEYKNNEYLHLGLLATKHGDIFNEFGEISRRELETYFNRTDNKYYRKTKIAEKIKKIERYEGKELIKFSFDEKKQRQYDLETIKDSIAEKQSILSKINEYKAEAAKEETAKARDKPLKKQIKNNEPEH